MPRVPIFRSRAATTAWMTALVLLVASVCAPAQESRLPDIGSSAGSVLGPAQQREYGQMLLSQLRHYDYVLDDPLVDSWLQATGNRLGAASDQPRQEFTFFMMKDRSINAFATLGGYIGVNAGLVLTAETEDEVAAVLGHEIAHVTQAHVLRSVERAQKDSVPILLAMLGAIAIAQSAGGSSAGDASMAALASAQGLMAQRQIDYTRSNESEADRLGIRTLSRGGYSADAMASMFERMQSASRTNQGSERERMPDYLKTHPVTTTRISEARLRAEQLSRNTVTTITRTPEAVRIERVDPTAVPIGDAVRPTDNPLLPWSLQLPEGGLSTDATQFGWARERLRVFSANTPDAAIREYERMQRAKPLDDAQLYGLALARLRDGRAAPASLEFAKLLERHPGDLWLLLGIAEAESKAGHARDADAQYEALLARMPRNRAVTLSYAQSLSERNTPEAGRRAQEVLRPLVAAGGNDPVFQRAFARACEIAGDPVRAGEAWAEASFLSGREEQALVQLNTLKKRSDLDYYARARIDARIATITPIVLELRRQGIRDPDLRRQ
ncbi:M48 family metalloprotease [Luteimonas sp. RIT-PG2_3]|jgi:predicted Zn-dependent protease